MPAPRPSERRLAIRDSIFAQMMGTVLPVLLRQGGLSALLVMALLGDEAEFEIGVVYLIMQASMAVRLFAAPHVDTSRRRQFLVKWVGFSCISSALLLVVPALGVWVGSWWAYGLLMVSFAGYFGMQQVGGAAWWPLLHAFLPSSVRGRYFGNMRRAWQITSFGAVFVAGAVLGEEPTLSRFYLVLVPAVLLQFGRIAMYRRLPDPPPVRTHAGPTAWRRMLAPLRDRDFRRFVSSMILVLIVLRGPVPFFVPFLKTELRFPASMTLYGTGCFGVGSVLSVVAWGRLADRWGTRLVFVLSCIGAACGFVIVASVPPYDLYPLLAAAMAVTGLVIIGAAGAGMGISYTVRSMHLAPEEHVGPYLNTTQGIIGAATGITAAVTGALLDVLPEQLRIATLEASTFRALFLVAGAAILLMSLLVRRLPAGGEPALRKAASAAVARLRSDRDSQL